MVNRGEPQPLDINELVAALSDRSLPLPASGEVEASSPDLQAEINLNFPTFDTLLKNRIIEVILMDAGSFDLGGFELPHFLDIDACKQRQRMLVAFIKKQRRALKLPPLKYTLREPVVADPSQGRSMNSWMVIVRAYGTVSNPLKPQSAKKIPS